MIGRESTRPTEIGATLVTPTTESNAPKLASRDSKPVVLPAPGYDIGTLIGRRWHGRGR